MTKSTKLVDVILHVFRTFDQTASIYFLDESFFSPNKFLFKNRMQRIWKFRCVNIDDIFGVGIAFQIFRTDIHRINYGASNEAHIINFIRTQTYGIYSYDTQILCQTTSLNETRYLIRFLQKISIKSFDSFPTSALKYVSLEQCALLFCQ